LDVRVGKGKCGGGDNSVAPKGALPGHPGLINVEGYPGAPTAPIRFARNRAHLNRFDPSAINIALAGESLPDYLGFDFSLIVERQVPEISAPDAAVGFSIDVSFWPDMRHAVGAWVNDRHDVGESMRFLDVGDNYVHNISGCCPGDKKNLAIGSTEAKTTVHYLANLKSEGLASNQCHPFSLRNHFCAGVFGIHVSCETTDSHPGRNKAHHS